MAHKPKVQYFKDEAGEFRFRIRGGNGRTMATSEGYTSQQHAERGWDDLCEVIHLIRNG